MELLLEEVPRDDDSALVLLLAPMREVAALEDNIAEDDPITDEPGADDAITDEEPARLLLVTPALLDATLELAPPPDDDDDDEDDDDEDDDDEDDELESVVLVAVVQLHNRPSPTTLSSIRRMTSSKGWRR